MKAIIAAAWWWTRMLPITKSIPKEMLPVGTKPVIHYIVEWLSQAGIDEILMVISNWKEALQNYFDKNFELEQVLKEKWKHTQLEQLNKIQNLANIAFVKQKKQLWFAHAILSAKPFICEDYFLLTVWDTIFEPKLFEEILTIHQKTQKPVIALKEIPFEDVTKYGVVEIKDNKIVSMVEKPALNEAPSNLIMVGVYILPRKIFQIIENLPLDEKTWEYLLPDVLKNLMEEEEVIPYITQTKVYDTWNPQAWLKANLELI